MVIIKAPIVASNSMRSLAGYVTEHRGGSMQSIRGLM